MKKLLLILTLISFSFMPAYSECEGGYITSSAASVYRKDYPRLCIRRNRLTKDRYKTGHFAHSRRFSRPKKAHGYPCVKSQFSDNIEQIPSEIVSRYSRHYNVSSSKKIHTKNGITYYN